MIEIEKEVPIPLHTSKYPWHRMEVGDSFWVEGSKKKQVCLMAMARRFKPKRFCTRKEVSSEEVRGLRCWRIE